MIRKFSLLLCCWLLLGAAPLLAATTELPASFFGETADSPYKINYDDLDYVLNASVLLSGPPNRRKSKASSAAVNTRLKNNYNPLTTNAGNRISFEEFKKSEGMRKIIGDIRASLSAVPDEVPLSAFSNQEQLAYWLNLYNITVIDEIIKIYPKKNLEDFVVGEQGLLQKKLLKVAGVNLSLNDIQYRILKQKFSEDPLVIYGLYQGYIGSPSIRKQAYTGENIRRSLQFNAHEFINSNRGTYPSGDDTFRVAAFYQRNSQYFPDFKADLSRHLKEYLRNDDLLPLETAQQLVANIDDWTVTDIFGTSRNYGGGSSTNEAALLGAFTQANMPVGMEEVSNLDVMGQTLASRAVSYGRFSADQVVKLREMKQNYENRGGIVTVTDLDSQPQAAEKTEEDKSGQ